MERVSADGRRGLSVAPPRVRSRGNVAESLIGLTVWAAMVVGWAAQRPVPVQPDAVSVVTYPD